MSSYVIPAKVFCHAGHKGEQEPRRFIVFERELEVLDIVDQWLAPEHRYFKLRASDGATYILRHDSVNDLWELSVFQRGSANQ